MDLSRYRFTDHSELHPFIEKMGETQFFNYARSVYERLFNMKSGETFDITKKVAEENREMFVKIACCYIIDHQTFHQFNDTFTIITRYDESIKMDRTGEGVRSRSTRKKDLRGDRT